jgi:hypothetical protein
MTLTFDEMKEILAWSRENGVKCIELGPVSCQFFDDKGGIPSEDLQKMLDKDGNLSPDEYEEILYHSARP